MASREESHLLVEGSDSSGDDSDDSPAVTKTLAGAAPPRAKISRARVVPTTTGKRNNERAAHKGISTNFKKMSLWDRVKEFS